MFKQSDSLILLRSLAFVYDLMKSRIPGSRSVVEITVPTMIAYLSILGSRASASNTHLTVLEWVLLLHSIAVSGH